MPPNCTVIRMLSLAKKNTVTIMWLNDVQSLSERAEMSKNKNWIVLIVVDTVFFNENGNLLLK
jgi:hypothetical protein